jgi:hypothetical protein
VPSEDCVILKYRPVFRIRIGSGFKIGSADLNLNPIPDQAGENGPQEKEKK